MRLGSLKKILSHLIIVLMGGMFLLSAYTKLFPIEYFEALLVKYKVISWTLSKFLARIIISFEFFVGLLLVAHVKLKYTLKLAFGVLMFFTLFLIFQLILKGNEDNCGCFGSVIEFSITEAIIKNVVSMLLIFLVIKWKNFTDWNMYKWLFWIVGVGVLITVNIINPPINIYDDEYISLESKVDIRQDTVISDGWKKGEKMLLFFSTKCGHCKQTAFRVSAKYPSASYNENFLVVFSQNANTEECKEFLKSQEIPDFSYVQVDNANFIKYTEGSVPRIAYLKDGVSKQVYREYDFFKEDFSRLKNK